MNIYEIKYRVAHTGTHYFDRDSMKFFGQTLRDYRVKKLSDTEWLFYAPMYARNDNGSRRCMGTSIRVFDATTNSIRSATADEESRI